ncbi:MAG: DUF87 domain-containing protein [Candidatus Saccharimonadales bacterium]
MQHFINNLLNLPVDSIESYHLNSFWTLVVGLVWLYLVAVVVLLICLFGLIIIRGIPQLIAAVCQKLDSDKQLPPLVFLELVFPSDMSKSAYATEQLYVLLRGQGKPSNLLSKLAGSKKLYSQELVSTMNDGIRYIMAVPTGEAEIVRHNLLSFLPGLKIHQVHDYMKSVTGSRIDIIELKLSEDFCLPLKDHTALEEHDPMAFITGHMTSLGPTELIAVQQVITPVRRSTHRRVLHRARQVRGVIARGEMLTPELGHNRYGIPRLAWICLLLPVWLAIQTLKIALAMIAAFVADSHSKGVPSFGSNNNKRLTSDLYEQELASQVKTKLDQNLFEVSLRILVAADSDDVIARRINAIVSAYHTYSSPSQLLVSRSRRPFFRKRQMAQLQSRYTKRQLTPSQFSYGSIVSSSELSGLYHFPNTNMTKTEGLIKSRSKELAAPLSMKRSDVELDVILGTNSYGGKDTSIGQTLEQRQKHTYIIGKTGTGKTTMLINAIYQDMLSGKGLAVLDPHGDMFNQLLEIVPKHRRKDVVVFNPADRDWPVGLNMLDPGIVFANEDDRIEWTTSTVIAVFKKLADEKQWGQRMEYILNNATMTALQLPNPSLYTIQRLLTEKKYQKEVAKNLKDPVLRQFWQKEFALLDNRQLANDVAPLTHRLGHFITRKMSRHILLQQKSTLRIADIMDEGKILLVNLAKGSIGADQSQFFGTVITSFIWMAAYQRTRLPEPDRRDFFLYVDEFQNFATPDFAQITSEGRKFRVSLTVSHQNTAQIEDKALLKTMAGNANTIVCLKASPDDETFILPFMKPVVEKGDIVNLAPYHFYMVTTSGGAEDAFSGKTVQLRVKGSATVRDEVVASSQNWYATPRAEVEQQLEVLFGQPPTAPTKNPVTSKARASVIHRPVGL